MLENFFLGSCELILCRILRSEASSRVNGRPANQKAAKLLLWCTTSTPPNPVAEAAASISTPPFRVSKLRVFVDRQLTTFLESTSPLFCFVILILQDFSIQVWLIILPYNLSSPISTFSSFLNQNNRLLSKWITSR